MRLKTILVYILVIAAILLGLIIGEYVYIFGNLKTDKTFQNKMDNIVQMDSDDDENIPDFADAKIKNIAIFGIDAEKGNKGRSDAVMIISVDNEHDKIKITSIARDSLVYIPQRKTKEKLTHAYSYGGASLAVAAINKNFNTNIKDYVSVNFSEMAEIVDLVGGVEVNLSEEESKYMNEPDLKAGNNVKLNGKQAVMYSRIRYIDSDIVRASRQREILTSLFYKAKEMKKTDYPKFIRKCMKLCTTSMNYKEIVSMVPSLLNPDISLEQFSCPTELKETVWGGIMDSGVWCWVYNTKGASKAILSFIYEDIYSNSDVKLPKATITTNILTDSEWKRNVA